MLIWDEKGEIAGIRLDPDEVVVVRNHTCTYRPPPSEWLEEYEVADAIDEFYEGMQGRRIQ